MSGQTADRILGVDPELAEFDLDGVQASLGLDASATGTTYRELQDCGPDRPKLVCPEVSAASTFAGTAVMAGLLTHVAPSG